jgi:hypothetical protein
LRKLDFEKLDLRKLGETTMAKPPLTVVDPAATGIPPPRKLQRHGTELWRSVMADYQIEDSASRELLCQACAALDRAESLAERIEADGEIVHGRQGPRPHPALKPEMAARTFIVRTLERLGLFDVAKPMGRPSRMPAWKA